MKTKTHVDRDQLSIMTVFLTEGTIKLLEDIAKDSNQNVSQVVRGIVEEALLPFSEDSEDV